MNIVFLTHYFYPHIGGVETHVLEVSKSLIKKGNMVTIVTEKYDKKLNDKEVIGGIKVIRFSYPEVKGLGILFIWKWLLKNRQFINDADVIHCHDVFIWYLPLRFMFSENVYTTLHGWEGKWPIPFKNIWLKRLATRGSTKSIAVGAYIEKYYKLHTNKIMYGACSVPNKRGISKRLGKIVFVGRLAKDTGMLEFLSWLKNKNYKVDFCGDGPLKEECSKYGMVHGFTDPTPYYKKAEFCVPGGYLAALEALSYGCELKLFWNNKLKEDYWKMSPFWKLKGDKLKAWASEQTWDKLANEYLDLYNSIK